MNIDAFLQTFARFGIHLGLETSQALMDALDNPQDEMPVIHVAGSNGKGSVCAYLSSILAEAGYRVGRYTSPHLVSWTERICINGKPIAASDLWNTLQTVKAAIPIGVQPTQFEIFTAAMWLYFAEQEVDIAVIEVGLGGRLDATNVVDEPLLTIITSISLEHTERLGDTLEKIAAEKAGILKKDCPTIIGKMPEAASAVITRRAYELYCPTFYPAPAQPLGQGWAAYEGFEWFEIDDEGVALVPRTLTFEMPLPGEVQLNNVSLAIAAMLLLRHDSWEITDEAITTGIAKTQWLGRLQWYSWQGHKILIDGAHNPDSAKNLRAFVDRQPIRHLHWVMGMLSTKNHQDMFEHLLRSGDSVYLVPVPGHSSADLSALVTLAKSVCPGLERVWVFDDVQKGLQAATKTAQFQELVVLCGSLYLLGHFFEQEGVPNL
ncbi:bifunctional folylpolyglutamate synthase/dihydrofolate synthase [Alkalinema pantanalense CENA528]|uniref:bifunctional folylpolyglutamate synthase/dihydrofolate synthase n=1 Tax=Alkalinema pantanalense TaxID=1620705 RepID=UPI003D6F0B70